MPPVAVRRLGREVPALPRPGRARRERDEDWTTEATYGLARASWCGKVAAARSGVGTTWAGRWRCGGAWCHRCGPIRGALPAVRTLDVWTGNVDESAGPQLPLLMATLTPKRRLRLDQGEPWLATVGAWAAATGMPAVVVAEVTPRLWGGAPCPLCLAQWRDDLPIGRVLRILGGRHCPVCQGTGEVGAGHLHAHVLLRCPRFTWGATDPLRQLWAATGELAGNIDYMVPTVDDAGTAYAAGLYAAGVKRGETGDGKTLFWRYYRQECDIRSMNIGRRVRRYGGADGLELLAARGDGDRAAPEWAPAGEARCDVASFSVRGWRRLGNYAQVPRQGDDASGTAGPDAGPAGAAPGPLYDVGVSTLDAAPRAVLRRALAAEGGVALRATLTSWHALRGEVARQLLGREQDRAPVRVQTGWGRFLPAVVVDVSRPPSGRGKGKALARFKGSEYAHVSNPKGVYDGLEDE